MVGGAIFGGPIGAASSMINALIEHETGRDIPQSILQYAKANMLNMPENQARTFSEKQMHPLPDYHKTNIKV